MFKHLGLALASFMLVAALSAAEPAATVTPAAPAAPAKTDWLAGTHYFVIDPAQPTASGDKIEVLEIFSYACPHCAHFQPYAEQLKASLPAYASFDYMPAIFNAQWEPFARAYYTAKSLDVLDKTHQELFDALHRDHVSMTSIDELANFYAQHGVAKAKFLSESASFEVESKLARATQIVKADGIDGTPCIVVEGKYRVTAAAAGGYPQLIELVDWLVKKEHAQGTKSTLAAKQSKAKK